MESTMKVVTESWVTKLNKNVRQTGGQSWLLCRGNPSCSPNHLPQHTCRYHPLHLPRRHMEWGIWRLRHAVKRTSTFSWIAFIFTATLTASTARTHARASSDEQCIAMSSDSPRGMPNSIYSNISPAQSSGKSANGWVSAASWARKASCAHLNTIFRASCGAHKKDGSDFSPRLIGTQTTLLLLGHCVHHLSTSKLSAQTWEVSMTSCYHHSRHQIADHSTLTPLRAFVWLIRYTRRSCWD